MRKNSIELERAQNIMDGALELKWGREHEVAPHDVLRLVSISTCSACNCEFIAVANDLDVPLVISDKQILRDFPQRALSLSAFCD